MHRRGGCTAPTSFIRSRDGSMGVGGSSDYMEFWIRAPSHGSPREFTFLEGKGIFSPTSPTGPPTPSPLQAPPSSGGRPPPRQHPGTPCVEAEPPVTLLFPPHSIFQPRKAQLREANGVPLKAGVLLRPPVWHPAPFPSNSAYSSFLSAC